MTAPGADVIIIPARLLVRDLSQAISKDIEEVQAALQERDHPSGSDDYLSGALGVAVAAALGVKVAVEPRDLALEYLYTFETVGEVSDNPDGRAGRLVGGVSSSKDELDAKIESASEHWSVARMPVVDRNILRIGLFELLSEPDVPTAVIVAEAVRLAQTYSTERSGSFVNGVLATLAKAVRG